MASSPILQCSIFYSLLPFRHTHTLSPTHPTSLLALSIKHQRTKTATEVNSLITQILYKTIAKKGRVGLLASIESISRLQHIHTVATGGEKRDSDNSKQQTEQTRSSSCSHFCPITWTYTIQRTIPPPLSSFSLLSPPPLFSANATYPCVCCSILNALIFQFIFLCVCCPSFFVPLQSNFYFKKDKCVIQHRPFKHLCISVVNIHLQHLVYW